MKRVSIQVSPTLIEWVKLKQWISTFCREQQITESVILTLQLVCEEWFTNIIVHGYKGGIPAQLDGPAIEVSVWQSDEREIIIEFSDAAPAFNPLDQPDPDVTLPAEDRPIGGLGIYLIKTKMDSCSYRRIGDRNQLTMCKKIVE